MKIDPVNNYKKPHYAMAIVSVLTAAGTLSACTDGQGVTYSGESPEVVTKDSNVEIPGEDVIATDYSEPEIKGEFVIPEESTFPLETESIVQLAGDVAVISEEESELAIAGVLPAYSDSDNFLNSYTESEYIQYDGGLEIYTDYAEDTTTANPDTASE